jgi:serine/threonine protein kinase
VRFGTYEILERREIEGEGFDALARAADGDEVRLWAGRPGSGTVPGSVALDEQRGRLAKIYHAALPRVLGAEVIEDRAVLVTAPYRGRLLADRLGEGPLESAAALELVKSVGAGLAKAHARDVVHGAVGPTEILLGDDGRTLLLHVGLGPFLGSREPRAPAGEVPADDDVFGLVRVLFECLSGRDGFSAGVFLDPARPDPEEMDPSLPEGLRRLVARALLQEPATRLRRAEELAGDLGVIRASWGQKPARPAGRFRVRLGVVLVGLGVAIGLWAAWGWFEALLR